MLSYAIIGLGEVGSIFARQLLDESGGRVFGYDISPAACDNGASYATICSSPCSAAAQADVVFVAVTAATALDVMRQLAGGLSHSPYVVDLNSVSPATRCEASAIVEEQGGRYVEAVMMASVLPRGLRTLMLLGGRHSVAWGRAMAPFRMNLEFFGDRIGGASSVKMCRSIMTKGIEALTIECLFAARRYGVEDEVLASLSDTLPCDDLTEHARSLILRALHHGQRRYEEMHEVARTVTGARLQPMVANAIADRQAWAGRLGDLIADRDNPANELGALLDAMISLSDGDAHRSPRHISTMKTACVPEHAQHLPAYQSEDKIHGPASWRCDNASNS